MCISAEALALFLNLLAAENITREPGHIVIHASKSDAHWNLVENRWCTDAPQDEARLRREKEEHRAE